MYCEKCWEMVGALPYFGATMFIFFVHLVYVSVINVNEGALQGSVMASLRAFRETKPLNTFRCKADACNQHEYPCAVTF
jgi:hypothetical protein